MLTEFQKEKLPRLFAVYDADANGFVEREDFVRLTQSFAQARGWEPGDEEYDALEARLLSRWQSMRQFADADHDDRVSLDEWLAYVDDMLDSEDAYEAEVQKIARSTFGVFDRDGDGKLDLAEYQEGYRSLGLDEALASDVFRRLDLDYDGYISKSEHLTLVDQFFRSQNPHSPGNWVFGPGK
jgi:juvenile hormone diol kinase